jgi:hypothetical protein
MNLIIRFLFLLINNDLRKKCVWGDIKKYLLIQNLEDITSRLSNNNQLPSNFYQMITFIHTPLISIKYKPKWTILINSTNVSRSFLLACVYGSSESDIIDKINRREDFLSTTQEVATITTDKFLNLEHADFLFQLIIDPFNNKLIINGVKFPFYREENLTQVVNRNNLVCVALIVNDHMPIKANIVDFECTW